MTQASYLLAIDLEESGLPPKRSSAVVPLTENYLELLRPRGFKATFFCVGKLAAKYPELIRKITLEGHEIACHGYSHTPLNQLSPEAFETDTLRNKSILEEVSGVEVVGYRAPFLSVGKDTQWVYPILKRLGFLYSSSVLPARNPLYGWSDFGGKQKEIEGVWEFPVSVAGMGDLAVPFSSGVYFRVLPLMVLSYLFAKRARNGQPILGYLHPYDVDTSVDKEPIRGVGNGTLVQFLMNYGRKATLSKVEKLLEKGYCISPYRNYVSEQRGGVRG